MNAKYEAECAIERYLSEQNEGAKAQCLIWLQQLTPVARKESDLMLIAAAPALLEACEKAIEYIEKVSSDADHYHSEIMTPLREAVKLAKGELP